MNRPGFIHGVGFALVAALLGEVVFVALAPLLGTFSALLLVIIAASFGYTLYLLRYSGERTGRLVTLLGWLLVTLLSAWWSLPLLGYVLLHVALIWLVRSLYYHSSVLIALADLGLNLFAIAAMVWATLQSGSLALALWCFFLVQALFVLLPQGGTGPGGSRKGYAPIDPFEQARQTAQTALRKLSSVN